jgi:hypothetical protein
MTQAEPLSARIRFQGTDPESIRRRLAEIEEMERYRRFELWRAVALLLLWPILSFSLLAWGLHTRDVVLGQVCVGAAAVVGTAGPLAVFVWLFGSDA